MVRNGLEAPGEVKPHAEGPQARPGSGRSPPGPTAPSCPSTACRNPQGPRHHDVPLQTPRGGQGACARRRGAARRAVPRRDEQGEARAGTHLWPPSPGPPPLPGTGRPPAGTRRCPRAPPTGACAAAAAACGSARSPRVARPAPLGTGSTRTSPGCPRHLPAG